VRITVEDEDKIGASVSTVQFPARKNVRWSYTCRQSKEAKTQLWLQIGPLPRQQTTTSSTAVESFSCSIQGIF